MRKAALWLFFIMVVSYVIAFSAIDEMNLNLEGFIQSIKDDNVLLFDDEMQENISQEVEIGLDAIEEIRVDVISSQVQVMREDRTDVEIILEGSYKAVPAYVPPRIETHVSGGILYINVEHAKGVFSASHLSTHLKVIIPEVFEEKIDIVSTSGDVKVSYGRFEKIAVETVSGNIDLTGVESSVSQLKSTSGEIEVDRTTGSVDARSISGDLDVKFEMLNANSSFESTSGDIKISLPPGQGCMVDFTTTSGTIETLVDMKSENKTDRLLKGKLGDGAYALDAKTVSGDIVLR